MGIAHASGEKARMKNLPVGNGTNIQNMLVALTPVRGGMGMEQGGLEICEKFLSAVVATLSISFTTHCQKPSWVTLLRMEPCEVRGLPSWHQG